MKFFLLLTFMIALPVWSQSEDLPRKYCQLDQNSENKFKAIEALVDLYRPEIEARFKDHLLVVWMKTDDCKYIQANVNADKGGPPFLNVTPGILSAFSEPTLILAACHEVGHFLGHVTPKESRVKSTADIRLSLEGEADYFAGSCYRDYLLRNGETHVEQKIETAAREFLGFFNGKDAVIDPVSAENKKFKKYKGIDPEYPDPSCRLLSMLNGASDLNRPTCWYNPKKK